MPLVMTEEKTSLYSLLSFPSPAAMHWPSESQSGSLWEDWALSHGMESPSSCPETKGTWECGAEVGHSERGPRGVAEFKDVLTAQGMG